MTTHRIGLVAALITLASTAAAAQPVAATLISPSSDVNGTTIAFTWQSAPTATWYQFWLGKADTSLVMDQWYTAEHAGCATGGTCTITVTPPITAGGFIWHIRTWSSAGYGPWSSAHMFTMRDVAQAWSGKLPASRRFTIVLDGLAVLDNETGLVWQRTPVANLYTWAATRHVCGQADTGGRLGWRAPSLAELSSLVDRTASNPSLPLGHPFVLSAPPSYWSQMLGQTAPDYHYAVSFVAGAVFQGSEIAELKIWCVRGGTTASQ